MNASILDADAPFTHLLRSRFHIKPVIAHNPSRHDSHSGCHVIWMRFGEMPIFMHIHSQVFLTPASLAALKIEQLSFYTSHSTVEYCTCKTTIQHSTNMKCAITQHCSVEHYPAAALLQLHLLGRSSVSEWTSLWLFGIPMCFAEREVSLKDTFLPLLCSNSIVHTG